jgi:hypothetical protein
MAPPPLQPIIYSYDKKRSAAEWDTQNKPDHTAGRAQKETKRSPLIWAKALSQASVVLCLPARRARTPAPTHGAAIGWCLVDDMCVFDVRGSRQEASLIMSSLHARGRSTNSVLR